jgi:hypothetical protein
MKDLIRTILFEYRNNIEESNIIDINKVSPNIDVITEKVLYPIINDLFRGINKIKRNQFDKLTDSEKSTILEIFPTIIDKKTKEFNKGFKITYDNAVINDKLIYLYNVKTLKGKDKKISIGLFYDDDNLAYMNDSILLLNTKNIGINGLTNLKSTVRHELIHAVDPKVNDAELYSRIESKYVNKSYQNYAKLAHEFDSFSHELITTIKDNLDMIDDGEKKIDIIKKLWLVIDSLKTKSKEELNDEYSYDNVIRLFTPNGVTSKNNTILRKNFWQGLSLLEAWKTKPTLYNVFYKRLVRFIPYIK